MGACATKPKVLKADSGDAPAPAPAPELSQEKTVPETKLENGSSDAQGTEIVDEDKVDSKPRCLSHLFNDQVIYLNFFFLICLDREKKKKKKNLDEHE